MVRTCIWLLVVLNLSLGSLAYAQTCPPGNERVAPNNRYTNHGNGTVTDSKTALMWKQCSEGQSGASCTGTLTNQVWQTALNTANNSTFANYSDWRLPSSKELQSLVETGCHWPAINTTLFPNTPPTLAVFWTSTTYAFDASFAWYVGFDVGFVGRVSKSNGYGVRLVRAGQ